MAALVLKWTGYVAGYKGLAFITIRGAGHINRSDHLPSSHLFFRGSFHLPSN
ncbi:serine carboxypeptidase II-3-like [Pyrus ussuriensis x Pyrus communis]|uniref:Serine carboxypeptidase II-3-like n=1 Tax=Pyrus ussuriensis x Pyrus communis TaxID=2448454 RepID=A0A5N5GUS3_9ROSA|nr:serine carboxypeptidase II-3-like [Pyrus ussuriensis x Pyrus communis]